jgi:Fanconi anemia group I protein
MVFVLLLDFIHVLCTFPGSEDLWVLANLTDALVLESLGSHEQSIHGFTSNSNSTLAQLHSFARPSLKRLSNFTDIFNSAVENDYTSPMWDEDTTLVIYIYNLSSPMRFKITVDQQNLWFLLYFFITFITYVWV